MAAEPVANPAVRPAAVAPKRHIVDVAPWPEADFAEFGEIETRPVPRIQQLVGGFLSRNWVMIPHVTHHDEADITALDAFRKGFAAANPDVKVTALILLIKAVVSALKAFPQFNASLDASGKNLVMKKYFHIGIAVDAPSGLLVPVIRDCDKKSVVELAREVAAISAKARSKGLSVAEMSGGCFSISALGSIGRCAARTTASSGARCCPCRSATTTASSMAPTRPGFAAMSPTHWHARKSWPDLCTARTLRQSSGHGAPPREIRDKLRGAKENDLAWVIRFGSGSRK
jgi:pyruvate dehydrogenase E2 component (dihydrolipoamide acetyltransferase)